MLGFFGGPPCETWSEARFTPLEGSKVRPVRAIEDPWGKPACSVREMRQVFVANIFMFFCLICFLLQMRYHYFGMLEHPAPSRRTDRPSIWRTDIWQLIERFDCVRVLIHQGLFGAPSPKPTCLAFTPARDWIYEVLQAHRSQLEMPTEISIGKDSSGVYKTSRLKEYPGPLNRALGAIFGRWHSEVLLCSDEQKPLPPDIAHLFVQLEVEADAVVGPDYVPPKSRIISAC